MDLRQLAMVVAVAEEGGFTAAAHRLRTVQSTVSTVVRALERDLGTPLFHRTTHRVVLTPAGEAFVPAARAALEAAERARAAVSPVHGIVRLGVCPGLFADLDRVLTAVRDTQPGLRVEVRQVADGEREPVESDVDMVLTTAPATGGAVTLLCREELVLVTAPGGSRSVAGGSQSAPDGSRSAPGGSQTAPSDSRSKPGGSRSAPSDLRSAPGGPWSAPGSSPSAPSSSRSTPGGPQSAPSSSPSAPSSSRSTPGGPQSAPSSSPSAASGSRSTSGGSRCGDGELSGLALVDFPVGWAIRAAVDRYFPGRSVSVEVDDLGVAARLVRAGLAACVLPASVAARFGDLAVRRFDRPPAWQLAVRHSRRPSAAVGAVLAQLTGIPRRCGRV
ncbi:LysR family transcriptional regulator [Amycolatopsis sp. NEAU-NG30]|uniref:LysR family transcriptional regulator n=1 Tax=Amycolatopsis melonis TaxID=3156488 RepID=A0ABV0LT92_9PSEU